MPDCPNYVNHTYGPADYVGNYEWREAMLKTHTVSRCPDCMRWVMWAPKADHIGRTSDG